MKKIFVFILCIVILSSFITSCKAMENKAAERDYPYENIPKDPGYNYIEAEDVKYNAGAEVINRKIIKNAEAECSADDIGTKYKEIVSWLKANDGYEFSQDMTNRGAYRKITAVLKIAPEKLDALIEIIGDKTEIINLRSSSSDITEEYFDIQLRIKSNREALERYYEFLEKAVDINQMTTVQREIDSLISEIERMEGKIAFWDKNVSESTLTLSLYQNDDPEKPKPESVSAMPFGEMLDRIGGGFMNVLNLLGVAFQWLLIIAISASPVLAIAAASYFVYRFIKKRNKKLKTKDNE